MKRFARLYCELDQTNRTNEKVAALERYFREAPPEDAAWGLHFLIGKKIPRFAPTRALVRWAAEEAGIPEWLFGESYDAVGDLGETMALLLHRPGPGTEIPLHQLVLQRILQPQQMPEEWRREILVRSWREMNSRERLVFNKLLTGAFRVGVAKTLVVRALANISEIEPAIMAHRISGPWEPTAAALQDLLGKQDGEQDPAKPYPFYLASPLDGSPAELGPLEEWQAEWKWDGIRAQLIRRQGRVIVWSRGEELVTETFPEIAEAGRVLPEGVVLDGEILSWSGEEVNAFSKLQRRLGRKKVDQEMQKEFPVVFLAYDLLEKDGKDLRAEPLVTRRKLLGELLEGKTRSLPLRLSPVLQPESWDALEQLQKSARERKVEGIMLKRLSSPYGVGRTRGDWWKWKIDPYFIDAVLIYAQRGNGRRASLYTDYTFGLWDKGELVPIAKAYSGLSDEEIRRVDHFVRFNTLDKHGPVRVVKPELVFELAFEGLQVSKRHRAGIAVRFPRMHRWRQDKKAAEANTLDDLRNLLHHSERQWELPGTPQSNHGEQLSGFQTAD
jgi:DNA ligase-1